MDLLCVCEDWIVSTGMILAALAIGLSCLTCFWCVIVIVRQHRTLDRYENQLRDRDRQDARIAELLAQLKKFNEAGEVHDDLNLSLSGREESD